MTDAPALKPKPKKRGRPAWSYWNPGSLARSDYLAAPEQKHNPRTRRMERVK